MDIDERKRTIKELEEKILANPEHPFIDDDPSIPVKKLHYEEVIGALNILFSKVDRLEKLAEKLYHEVELYNIYIPRITDVLIRYFPTMDNYRKEINIMMMIHKGFLENIERELQDHFEFHSHSDKKTNKYNIYK